MHAVVKRFQGWFPTTGIVVSYPSDRPDRFPVLSCIVLVEILPVPVLLVINNFWKLVHLELLILGGMGIVEGPLLERDISTDKVDQPAVLLIKLMA